MLEMSTWAVCICGAFVKRIGKMKKKIIETTVKTVEYRLRLSQYCRFNAPRSPLCNIFHLSVFVVSNKRKCIPTWVDRFEFLHNDNSSIIMTRDERRALSWKQWHKWTTNSCDNCLFLSFSIFIFLSGWFDVQMLLQHHFTRTKKTQYYQMNDIFKWTTMKFTYK